MSLMHILSRPQSGSWATLEPVSPCMHLPSLRAKMPAVTSVVTVLPRAALPLFYLLTLNML